MRLLRIFHSSLVFASSPLETKFTYHRRRRVYAMKTGLVRITAKTKDFLHFLLFCAREASPYATWHEHTQNICAVLLDESCMCQNQILFYMTWWMGCVTESSEPTRAASISCEDFPGILSYFRLLKYQTFHLIWFRNEQCCCWEKGLRLKDLLCKRV